MVTDGDHCDFKSGLSYHLCKNVNTAQNTARQCVRAKAFVTCAFAFGLRMHALALTEHTINAICLRMHVLWPVDRVVMNLWSFSVPEV